MVLIDHGVLKTYLYDRQTAQKDHVPSNPVMAVGNLFTASIGRDSTHRPLPSSSVRLAPPAPTIRR